MRSIITMMCTLMLCACVPFGTSREAVRKYKDSPEVRQIVTVQYKGGSDAVVRLFMKDNSPSGRSIWKQALVCDGLVGKEGLGKTREGDNKTPEGDFGILTAFGIKPDPGTSLPYVDVTEDIWCCGDDVAYNRIIDISACPHDNCQGEHMIEYSPEYDYGLFLDYNKECIPGKGSAIFFHCTGAKPYTGGCIAVSEDDMVAIMKSVDCNARIIIGR